MPWLNWKTDSTIELKREELPRDRIALTLTASQDSLKKLAGSVRDAFAQGGELRVDLPEGWTLFWKEREGDTRALVAKPALGEWVATLAIEKGQSEGFLTRLGAEPGAVQFDSIPGLSRVSNFSLALVARESAR